MRYQAYHLALLATLALTMRCDAAEDGAPSPSQATADSAVVSLTSSPTVNDLGSTLSAEEIHSLRKLKIQQELQAELLTWAQTRFWIVAALAVLIGFFGVRALVREMLATELRDATRASADAQAAASQGRETIKDLRAEALRHKTEVEALATAAQDLGKQLTELRSRVDAESIRVGAAVELKVNALSEQISELAESLTRVAATSPSTSATNSPAHRIAELRASAESKDVSFAANSKYRVVVVHHGIGSRTEPFAKAIVDQLSVHGFKASLGLWSKDQKDSKKFVDVEIQHSAKDVGDVVVKIIAETLHSLGEKAPVKVADGSWPEDEDIRIFF